MEITSNNFWEALPEVLEAMAAATHIAIDLEMSGIFTNTTYPSTRPTIGRIYQQAKEAAERFQIVQFGLTCLHHGPSTHSYYARTFNFLITPSFTGNSSVDHQLAQFLDRYVGFSQRSVMFLRDHGFQMDRAFKDGVSYLSRTEILELNKRFLRPHSSVSDAIGPTDRVVLADHGQEAIEFHIYAYGLINAWFTNRSYNKLWFVNITNPHGGRLNHLQVRIITELVNDHFADCRAFPRDGGNFMQVVFRDKVREGRAAVKELAEKQDAVARQRGFTFIMEALMGYNFADGIPAKLLIDKKAGDRTVAIMQMTERLKSLESKLADQQPILVGHNSLYDLCFIYHSFVGPLPNTVEEFATDMHHFFPRIVDTKYLGRRPGSHSMLADDNLTELFHSASKMDMPRIISDPDLPVVIRGERPVPGVAAHQAGYDSWMTSVVFLKYAWALAQKADTYKSPTPEQQARAKEAAAGQAASLEELRGALSRMDFASSSTAWKKHWKFEEEQRKALAQPAANPALAPLLGSFPAPPGGPRGAMNPPNTSRRSNERPTSDPDASILDRDDGVVLTWAPLLPVRRIAAPSPTARLNKEALQEELTVGCAESFANGRVPDWDTRFWRVYGNKLRMGAVNVLDLDKTQA